MNESRFLFDLDMIVLILLDEGRRTYLLCRMSVLSLNIRPTIVAVEGAVCDVGCDSVVYVLLTDVMHDPVQLEGPVQLLVVDDTFLVRPLMMYVDRLPNHRNVIV